jgi:XTP/dITP diphosphohydrolase
MTTKKIVLASGNKGKLAEFSQLFRNWSVGVVSQGELSINSVPETGTTFIENAIIKARHAAEQSGLPALADDSGLVVEALNGAPGIYSSRFAGEEASDEQNLEKLLHCLKDQDKRRAHFQCVLVFMRSAEDPVPMIAQGQWYGSIATCASGFGGFGYDPIFWCPEYGCNAAELDKDIKNTISHRAKALALLNDQLSQHMAAVFE